MFGDFENNKKLAEELLEMNDFETILEENDLELIDVLEILIDRGLIDTSYVMIEDEGDES